MPTFDVVRLTAYSESDPRSGAVDTMQYHHGTLFSLAALEDLMEPGGRTVSANCALDTDGTLVLKVPLNRRAFTSGSSFDHRCITVETVNTSGAPDWGISDASHRRLGKLAAEMYQEGQLGGLFYGPGGIIGHRDVPGTYPTACPGPCFDSSLILKYAREYLTPTPRRRSMTTRYAQIGTGDDKGGAGTLIALAGDVGYPCPGNFDEYVRSPADGGRLDRAAAEYLIHGPVIWVRKDDWSALRDRYTKPPTVGKLETTPDPEVVKRLERIETAILKPRTTTAAS